MDCARCHQRFDISNEEKVFLEKITPAFDGRKFPIPLPIQCPDCRLQLRTIQRNEQYLYRNKSHKSGQQIISLYAPDKPWSGKWKVLSHEEWWSNDWDAQEYAQDIDLARPFFDQFQELNLKVPRVALIQVGNENCPFTTGTGYCKNCHLINCSENCEDCYYGKLLQGCRDVMDASYAYESELLYECFYVTKCYNCIWLSYSQNCSDCHFSENLKGCKNCFLSTNLANKEFYFKNQQLSKHDYEAKIKEYFGSFEGVEKAKNELTQLRRERIHKYANIINNENSSGDFLTNCRNCNECYDVNDSEDCRYITVGVNVKDLIDCSNMYLKPELNYQVMGTIETYNVHFSAYIFHCQNVFYSQFCYDSRDLFGCVGMRKKQYCIFNKQYTKETYEKRVAELIECTRAPASADGGRKTGEWGAYFPPATSPYAYNETVAHDYLPLTKEEALAQGFNWRDIDEKEYMPQTYHAPKQIRDVQEDILKELLACETCGKNYRIIPQELKKLQAINMPIPRTCPDCRHRARMSLRNPRHLYRRACAKCSAPITTTYAPEQQRVPSVAEQQRVPSKAERPETVYCEKCYLEAVY